jgi:CRISPR/Cas system-associated exonuclease Cas4 (RecB family)
MPDTILCSDGLGERPKAECLACARNGAACGYDYVLLRKMFEMANRTGIHVSDLTGCLKLAYLKRTQPVAEYPHEMLARTLGTITHGFLEGSDVYLDAELDLDAMGILGRADVVYKDGRVLDLKTTRWIQVERLPYGSHALQVNIYAHLLRKMGREVKDLWIQYIDLSGPTKCRKCKVPVRPAGNSYACPKCGNAPYNAHLGAVKLQVPMMEAREIEGIIAARRDILDEALKAGLAPKAEPGFLCAYCGYRDLCSEAEIGE